MQRSSAETAEDPLFGPQQCLAFEVQSSNWTVTRKMAILCSIVSHSPNPLAYPMKVKAGQVTSMGFPSCMSHAPMCTAPSRRSLSGFADAQDFKFLQIFGDQQVWWLNTVATSMGVELSDTKVKGAV
ncbi:unnamed protein product [Caretta caretta]